MIVENWGLIDYKKALDKQVLLVEEVAKGNEAERIIICHHPSVVTLGKKTEKSDIGSWTGPTYKVQRGGRATYHGPGQVVAYPVVNLQKRNNDIYKYLRNLELSMVNTLKAYGIVSTGNSDSTGVWIGDYKIASIGVAIKRWVTYHGLAINIYEDKEAFKGINPCGMSCDVMTSLEKLLGKKTSREEFESKLAFELKSLL